MITLIAWRNIWRNTTRSLVVILAIALGIWAAMAMTGFATGMVQSYVSEAVQHVTSHVQVHHPEFREDYQAKFTLAHPEEMVKQAQRAPFVEAVSTRSIAQGMLSSPQAARGILIKAVEPEQERRTSALDRQIVEGSYFEGDRKNQILISRKLADKIKVGLRNKVVLTFQNLDRDITAGAFRVVGLFDTGNAPFDEGHVFVQRKDLNRLLTEGVDSLPAQPMAHELAILLSQAEASPEVAAALAGRFPDMEVQTYRELAPELELYESQIQYLSLIYLTVIMLALIFGIVNTMLMAILERTRELGMLMAVGMNKPRVFGMIVQETLLLSLIGVPLGLLLGWGTVHYLGRHGLDLSAYSSSLAQYGMSPVIYFELPASVYWQVPIAVGITALLASLYPAWRAIRLRPVEAIRKI